MPAYNAEKTIQYSINSVLAQTFGDWELIIINDCSQDLTAQIVENAAKGNPNIHTYTNEKNLGIAASRNLGIQHAKGSWIAFLDSDDLWHKGKLEKQMLFIKETGAKISYTGTAYINSEGGMSNYILRAKKELTYKELLKRNLMSCSSVIVRRDIIKNIPFPEGGLHEDYAAWMQVLKETGCAYGLDEPLLIYRMAKESVSSGRLRSAKMIYNAYRQQKFKYPIALFLTLRYALHSIFKRFFIKMGRIFT